MGVFKRGAKKIIKPFFAFPKWIGYDQLKKMGSAIRFLALKSFIPQQSLRRETFDESLLRLNVTPEELAQRLKNFYQLMYVWLALWIGLLLYLTYLFSRGFWRGGLPCVGLLAIASVQIFRYHFWIFQIKKRHLGCSLRYWLSNSFSPFRNKNEIK